jgi:hypothetical protein
MPLMPVVFSCHKVIETPQQSSKVVADTSNGCLHFSKLGVGGKLFGLNTPILSFVTYTSASIPSVCFFTSRTKA